MENDTLFDFGTQDPIPNDDNQIDLFGNSQDEPVDNNGSNAGNSTSTTEDEDFITTMLRRGGIDRNAIRMQNDNGEMEEIPFDQLSNKEKLTILDSTNELPISDEEIETLNFLRANKMNLNEFAQWQQRSAIENFQKANAQSSNNYRVNDLSDEELYRFDLMDRYPDMTEEEIEQDLENAQTNQDTFNKKIEALRAEYKKIEDDNVQYEEQQQRQLAEEQYNQMASALVNVAQNTNDLHNLVIEDSDKEEILASLLDRDANGQSEFYKYFSDPNALFRMCWYIKYGDQAFNALENYWRNEVSKARRSQSSQTKVVKKPQNKNSDFFDLDKQYKNI